MLDWEWFTQPKTLSVFIYLLLSARHDEGEWRGITLSAGECVISRDKIASATGLSEQEVRTSLNRLKSTSEITIKSTNKYSVVTITNYASYQDAEDLINQQTNQQHNQQITNKQPANQEKEKKNQEKNKEINKNEKNERNIESNTDVLPKKNKTSSNSCFIKPTIEQIQEYCRDRGNNVDPERFLAYYESNGWRVGRNPMKDWKAAVRTWERQERYNGITPTRCEDQDRALFEAEIEAHRKQVIAERQAQKEQEILEKKNREDKKLLDIIFRN